MFKNFNFASILSIIIIGLFVGVIFVYADWSLPKQSPPSCSVDPADPNYQDGCNAPINVGSLNQTKDAGLGLVGDLSVGGLAVFNNKIGIGNDNPGYSLDIAGDVNITGAYRVNGAPVSLSSYYIGACSVITNSCKCDAGETIMLLQDLSFSISGGRAPECWVENQGTVNVVGRKNNSNARFCRFACFR